jgi:hypothetical protein
MPADDREPSRPTGPWSQPWSPPPRRAPAGPPQVQAPKWRLSWSTLVFMLLLLGVGIRAFKDLSRPDAWAYWKDQYFAPSLTASPIAKADLGGSGRGRPALAIRGKIGPAAASWLRTQLDEAHLAPGDLVLLSSPGGDLGQALIMGEIVRARGLATAVGTADDSGRVRPAYCASACVFIFAGGKPRYGVEGSQLGIHRFTSTAPASDAVADTQRTTGLVLGYMTKMGVSSSMVEAMSQTGEVRWLPAKDALAMNLVTDPLGKP